MNTNKTTRRKWLGDMAAAPLVLGMGPFSLARAQSYPSRPITIVVPFGAGNASDALVRLVAKSLVTSLGQPVVIENRPGAGGVGGTRQVASASPDGYTLLYTGTGATISQSLFKPAPYDMMRDFAPISAVSNNDVLILVRGKSPLRSLDDFVRQAKEAGKGLMVGVSLLGTTQHLAAELFKLRTRTDFTLVPFRSAAALINGLIAGDVQAAFEFVPPALATVRSGQLRALAVSSAKRSDALPQVPTATELGIPDFNVSSWGMFVAPAGTPDAVVQLLNRHLVRAITDPEVAKRLRETGTRPTGSTVAQARELVASEVLRWADVIATAKIALQ
ncbi:MAG TPA: tripartite tricarboxylate transporter substrate-binding protein [Ramlibacter sp.]|nr:tripartite tricarboxylate transporter substrate-binding protein [Ramlibacter sp.]